MSRAPRRHRFALTVSEYRERSTEAEMTETIAELVGFLGGRMWHVRDSRQAPETADMPDLVIIVPGLVAIVELKSQLRGITLGQAEVRDLLLSIPDNPYCVGWMVRPNPDRSVGERSYDELLERLRESRDLLVAGA